MDVPWHFLKAAAFAIIKHCGNAVGFGVVGDLLVGIGEDIRDSWGKQRKEEERRAEIEEVAQASTQEVVQQVAEIVNEVAANQPPEFQGMLRTYLTQVPAMIRKSMRRQSDPTGRSVSVNLTPNNAEDILSFLPPTLPRFKPGDHPLPGVDWELEQLLGMGGFGEVWKARNPHFDGVPPVALKFCLDRKAKDQLLRHEAAVLNQVMRQGKHSGIVQLLQTYLSADPPCQAYEYVEGGDLAGLIKEKKPKPDFVAKIILRLAEILGFAHQLNPPVVHRDLKPVNILVQQMKDKEFVLKIADFGIGGLAASQAIREVTHGTNREQFMVSALQGAYTPLYASPQQMRREKADPRDDVFSLGVIWYQMLTGNLFMGRPGGKKWREKLIGTVPSQVLDLLESCFEDDPDDRPVNAAELAEKLKGVFGESSSKPTTSPKKPLLLPKPGDIITNTLGMKFAWIPPGTFLMGRSRNEEGRKPYEGDDETQHRVTLTKGFYLGIHPVTRGQFGIFVQKSGYKTQAEQEGGTYFWTLKGWDLTQELDPSENWRNPGFEQTKDHPVTCVSWNDSMAFAKWLAEQDNKPYRLPTEAEWEYACRAGTTTPFHFGTTISTDLANYDGNRTYGNGKKRVFRKTTTPVGNFPPNAWGLHDMHGNVCVWCQDWYGDYPQNDVVDPQGPESGEQRVQRGGSWYGGPDYCRSAYRNGDGPGNRFNLVGCRLCFCLD